MVADECYLKTCVCSFAMEKSQSMGAWVMNWRLIHVFCLVVSIEGLNYGLSSSRS